MINLEDLDPRELQSVVTQLAQAFAASAECNGVMIRGEFTAIFHELTFYPIYRNGVICKVTVHDKNGHPVGAPVLFDQARASCNLPKLKMKRPPASSSLLPPRLGYGCFEALASAVRKLVTKTAPLADASRLTESVFGIDITEPAAGRKRKWSGMVQLCDKHVVLSDLFYSQARPVKTPLSAQLLEFAKQAAPLASLIGNSFGSLLRPLQVKIEALARTTSMATYSAARGVLAHTDELFKEINGLQRPKWDGALAVVPFSDEVIQSIRQQLESLLDVEKTQVMMRRRAANDYQDESFVHGLFILTTVPRASGTDVETYSKDYWLLFQFHEALRRGNPDLLISRGESSGLREWRDIHGPKTSILNFAVASLHTAIKQKFCVCLAGMMRSLTSAQKRAVRLLPPEDHNAVVSVRVRASAVGAGLEIKRHRRHWPYTKRPKSDSHRDRATLLTSEATVFAYVEAFCACPRQQLLLLGRGKPHDPKLAALLPSIEEVDVAVRLQIHILDYQIAVSGVFAARIEQEKARLQARGPSTDMDRAIVSRVKSYLTTVDDALFFGSEIFTNLGGDPERLVVGAVPVNRQHRLCCSQYTELFGGRTRVEDLVNKRQHLIDTYKATISYLTACEPRVVPREMLVLALTLGKVDEAFCKAVRLATKTPDTKLMRLDRWIVGESGDFRRHLDDVVRKTWGTSKSRCSSPFATPVDGAFLFDVVAIACLLGSIRVVANLVLCSEEAKEAMADSCLITVTKGDPHMTGKALPWPLQPLLAELAVVYLKGERTFLTGKMGRPAVTLSVVGPPLLTDEATSRVLLQDEMARIKGLYGEDAPSSFSDAAKIGDVQPERLFALVKWMDRKTGELLVHSSHRGIACGLESRALPFLDEATEASDLENLVRRSKEELGSQDANVGEADLFGSSDTD